MGRATLRESAMTVDTWCLLPMHRTWFPSTATAPGTFFCATASWEPPPVSVSAASAPRLTTPATCRASAVTDVTLLSSQPRTIWSRTLTFSLFISTCVTVSTALPNASARPRRASRETTTQASPRLAPTGVTSPSNRAPAILSPATPTIVRTFFSGTALFA